MLCDTCGDRKPYWCHITPEAKHPHTKKSAGLISHWKSCVTFFFNGLSLFESLLFQQPEEAG